MIVVQMLPHPLQPDFEPAEDAPCLLHEMVQAAYAKVRAQELKCLKAEAAALKALIRAAGGRLPKNKPGNYTDPQLVDALSKYGVRGAAKYFGLSLSSFCKAIKKRRLKKG